MSRKREVSSIESDTIRVADDVISVGSDTIRIADGVLHADRKPSGDESVDTSRTNSGLIPGSDQRDTSTWRKVWQVLWWRGH
jgi:hypothetical protein